MLTTLIEVTINLARSSDIAAAKCPKG